MKNILIILSTILYKFKRKNRILIIETHYPSGSNTFALMPELKKRGIQFDAKCYPNYEAGSILLYKIKLALFHLDVAMYDMVLNTNGYRKIRKNQILIDFWHGVPVKSMLYMEENKNHSSIKHMHNMDYLITSSKLESTLLASCMFVPFRRHKIMGSPRLELMMSGESNIIDLLSEQDRKKVTHKTKLGLFMPTFRKSVSRSQDGLVRDNVFNFEEFDINRFNVFLELNNIILIMKKHPLDTRKFDDFENIVCIDETKLIGGNRDLYEYLNSTDFLVTDYSSVMMDYAELEKPILLLAPDYNEYAETRGFLFNPYSKLIDLEFSTTQVDFEKQLSYLHNFDNVSYKLGTKVHEINGAFISNIVDWLIELERECLI